MELFNALLAQTIDSTFSTLELRCTLFGYQYSEILLTSGIRKIQMAIEPKHKGLSGGVRVITS